MMWKYECPERIDLFGDLNKRFCVVGAPWDSDSIKGIVWGDSHSEHFAPLLNKLATTRDISLVIAPLECPPYLNSNYIKEHYNKFPNFTEDCTTKQLMTINWINMHPEVKLIIMSAAWSGHIRMLYTDDHPENDSNSPLSKRSAEVGKNLSVVAMRATLASLDLTNRHVLLLGDIPRPNRNLNECAFNEISPIFRADCAEPYTFLDGRRVRAWHLYSNADGTPC